VLRGTFSAEVDGSVHCAVGENERLAWDQGAVGVGLLIRGRDGLGSLSEEIVSLDKSD
jgi:hypothetical protein